MELTNTYTGHKGPIYSLTPGRDGKFLSGSGDGSVVEWNSSGPDEGELIVTVSKAVFSLRLLADKRTLLIGNEIGGLHVIDLERKQEVQLFEVHQKGIFDIAELGDGKIACTGGDGSLSIWNLTADREAPLTLYRQIPIADEKLRQMAVSPDFKLLAITCGDGTVRIVDTEIYNELYTLEIHPKGATCVAYHPTKPVLISGGKDGHLRFWHCGENYRALYVIPAHGGTIYSIAFNAKGNQCATASRDKTIKLWEPNSFDPIGRLERSNHGHTHSVNALLWLGDRLITGSDDRSIRVWA